MTRYELERHLGKYVEIVLFDGTVIEGILHKTGEKAFLSIPGIRLLVIVFLDCPTLKKSVV